MTWVGVSCLVQLYVMRPTNNERTPLSLAFAGGVVKPLLVLLVAWATLAITG